MTKLFKNKVLAFVLAFAVLAVSLFTGVAVSHVHVDAATDPVVTAEGIIDLLEFGSYLTDMGSTSQYYDTVVADNGETGASWDDPIIIDSAEEFVYIAKTATNDTAGKYYKVADGIAGFDLSKGNLDLDGTLADNLANVQASGKNHAGGTPGFQGHFDGNGVTVYGAWTNHEQTSAYAGLFSCTQGDVTIKNVNVKFASFTATSAVGGIVGYHKGDGTNTLTIENCSITDSHLEYTGAGNFGHGIGAILGYSANLSSWSEATEGKDGNGDGDMADTIYVNGAVNIKNCYVNLDENYFISCLKPGDADVRGCHGGIAGFINTNAMSVSDCVVIGITPYATSASTSFNDVQHSGLESHFTNIYTTDDVAITKVALGGTLAVRDFTGKVFPLSDAQLKGAAAVENMDLDWSVWMADDDDYPELAVSHKNVTLVDNEDGTHAATCDCGFGGIAVDCTYVDGTCACGAELNCATRKTIAWDGTVATGIATGTGTKDDPYIIKTAAELAWLVQQKADVTTDKYYEIDESIGAIVLQSADKAAAIKALDSAAAVKDYFEAGSFTAWKTMGWEQSCFAGYFDGNGVTIYGMYATSADNAALFCTVDGGAAFRNLAIKNSYLTSSASNYQVAALIATSSTVGYGAMRQGVVWVSDVIIANNYLYNASTQVVRSGILGGAQEAIAIENCLAYGNDATYGNGVKMPLLANCTNGITAPVGAVYYDGFEPKIMSNETTGERLYYNTIKNSIVLGADVMNTKDSIGYRKNDPNCYSNVYTDGASGEVAFSNGSWTYTDEQIKAITEADLATLELGDAWINTATYPELKSFHDEVFSGDATAAGAAGHSASCSCGLAGSDIQEHVFKSDVQPPEWDSMYCEVCGYGCDHTDGKLNEYEGDCVTAAGYEFDCPTCGYHEEYFEEIAGHNFTVHEAQAGADCQTAGTIAYKSCAVCNKNYAENAADTEAFANAIADVTGELGECVVLKDGEDIVYGSDGNNHWTICAVCEAPITTSAHEGDVTDNGNGTHSVTCTVCLYASDAEDHSFKSDVDPAEWDSYYCEVCGYVCEHVSIEEGMVDYEGDCVTAEGYTFDCSICGYHEEYFEEIAGHNFTVHQAVAGADCQNEGTIAYKSCAVCNKNYAENAADTEAFENAITDLNDGVVGPCASTATTFEYNVESHFKKCDLCGLPVEEAAHQGVTTAHGAAGHAVECEVCNFADDEVPHVFGDDSVCDTCNWECTAHDFVEGDVVVEGDCLTDKEVATSCDICGIAGDNAVTAAPGHDLYDMEGYAADCTYTGEKAHVYCIECGKYFAEGTTDTKSTDYIDYDTEVATPVEPDAHEMRTVAAKEAGCEEDGNIEFEYCTICALLIVDEEETVLEISDEIMNEFMEKFDAAWDEVEDQINSSEDVETIWIPIFYSIVDELVIAVAAENDIELSIPAAHDLTEVEEVAATADKEGTKAHYACANCEKTFADADGAEEVTADELVIEKLGGGDDGEKAPVTGESIAVVAAVAALMGAAFVIIRKARKA